MQTGDIVVNGKPVKTVVVPLQHANIVLLIAANGYLMCGYLNLEAAEKFGDCAGIIRGVKNAEEMLEKEVACVTKAAESLGVKAGMKGRDAISKMF
jgi:uncharacterized protein YunC (DUF1805 family)